ncbi:unnamed protein product, partial [Mesorhabditis belari]|uniref:L-Fucosyltransferase n=1 Tax=Mesorhabditis belari TaxID=2138241 RepID=A0AAF3F156_9BILA
MITGWKNSRHPIPTFTPRLPPRHCCGLALVVALFCLFYLFFTQNDSTETENSQPYHLPPRLPVLREVLKSDEWESDEGESVFKKNETKDVEVEAKKLLTSFAKTKLTKSTPMSGPMSGLKSESEANCSLKFLFADFHASKYGGGVGNFMFEWISFLGIAKTVNRIPALHVRNDMVALMLKWQKRFPNILDTTSIKLLRSEVDVEFPYSGCCRYKSPKKIYKKYANATNVFSRMVYMQSYFYFNTAFTRDELVDLLRFHDDDKKVARLELVEAKYNINSTHNVCVHIRRGDFVRSTLHQHSTEEFTAESIRFGVEYAKTQTNRTVTAVLLGNDLPWEKKLIQTLGDLPYPVLAAKQNPDHWPPHIDWIFAQIYCDTVILTASASTYGWWLGYLSRGDQVLYNAIYSKKNGVEREMDEEKFWPKHWQKIHQDAQTKKISIVKTTTMRTMRTTTTTTTTTKPKPKPKKRA